MPKSKKIRAAETLQLKEAYQFAWRNEHTFAMKILANALRRRGETTPNYKSNEPSLSPATRIAWIKWYRENTNTSLKEALEESLKRCPREM